MRKRWQEALTSRESMASELTTATQPLLKQISSLQEALRIKSETYAHTEHTLTERALRAESAAEISAHKQHVSEEGVQTLKVTLTRMQTQLVELQELLRECEQARDTYKHSVNAQAERINELESRLQLETGQRNMMSTTLRDLDNKYKAEMSDIREAGKWRQQSILGNLIYYVAELAEKAFKIRIAQVENEVLNERGKAEDEKRKLFLSPINSANGSSKKKFQNLNMGIGSSSYENSEDGVGSFVDVDLNGAALRAGPKPLPSVLPSKYIVQEGPKPGWLSFFVFTRVFMCLLLLYKRGTNSSSESLMMRARCNNSYTNFR
jgi:chromosome segregation ATPase